MNESLHEKTDAVIAGCGIAGGRLAAYLAEAGFKVIVLEKRPRIGIPVRCGEAAGNRSELSHFLDIDDTWIAAEIKGARLESPGGKVLKRRFPRIGLVLNRDKFDQALAELAAARGADIRVNNEAVGLEYDGKFVTGTRVYDHKNRSTYTIKARVTIGADGIEALIGRWAGLRRHLNSSEIHSCYQYLMEGGDFEEDTIAFYTGEIIAPGGYIWVFPKGTRRANVGAGLHPSMGGRKTARQYLDEFVRDHFPQARVIRSIAGGTSGIGPLKTMVGNGVMLVGEAAGQNNPFSGGGIMNSLEGAEEASIVLKSALAADDVSEARLKRYDENWHKRNGETISKFAALRKFYCTLNDRDMDNIIGILDDMVPDGDINRIDYVDLFRAAFRLAPGLLWKARTLLW